MIRGPEDVQDAIAIDRAKKRIYLVFEGSLSLERAQQLKKSYGEAILTVGRGYTVLSYFKDFVPASPEVQEVFLSMIGVAAKGGCRKAARVSSASVFGPLQMGRLAKDASYPSRHLQTWREAEGYLDGHD